MEHIDTYCEGNEHYDVRTQYRENKDCTVMAMATAFDLPYQVAHKHLKEKVGRPDNQGVSMHDAFPRSLPFGMVRTHRFKIDGTKNNITLGRFCKQHPEGRFIVLVRGHALAVVDGIVYDHSRKPRRHVLVAYEVMEEFDEAA